MPSGTFRPWPPGWAWPSMQTERIPLVVGVTGHRAIRPEDEPILSQAVETELKKLRERFPHTPLVLLSSLAEGADQLCARAALKLGIPLWAPLPLPLEDYETDFSGQALDDFRALCAQAEQIFPVPAAEAAPAMPDRDFFYRQVGIYIATHCHVLLALWDGHEPTPTGCGTAETVSFALHRSFHPVLSAPLFSSTAVILLFTPRDEPVTEAAGTVTRLGDDETWRTLMDRTEEFNALTGKADPAPYPLLPDDRERDLLLDRMEKVYQRADALSLQYAKVYRRVLILLAVVSTLITASFLLYDEANLHWLILVCGLALLIAWLLQRYAGRSSCHRRYLEYRVLAESLRAQAFLRYAGVSREAVTLLPWSQQEETPWIAMAMTVLDIGERPRQTHDVRACWAEDQLHYHQTAQKKAKAKLRGSGRVVGVALAVSIALYLAALVFELLFGGLLSRFPAILEAESCRTLLKLVLGSISAATLFISNYYGKLSLSRGIEDHAKMAAFYERILDRMALCGQVESLLVLLAREELIENGNWCSYQRDNVPDFSL